MGGGHAGQGEAPERDHAAGELADGELDEDPGEGELHYELCDVDDGAEPRVLVPPETRVFDEPKDGRKGDGRLVQPLQEVDGQHEGQDDAVDASQHAGVVLGRHLDARPRGEVHLAEQRGGGVGLVDDAPASAHPGPGPACGSVLLVGVRMAVMVGIARRQRRRVVRPKPVAIVVRSRRAQQRLLVDGRLGGRRG